ncbi:MAG: hypothetical protein ACFE9S_07535 [Candidatus Hermodarchaeota archaeon]
MDQSRKEYWLKYHKENGIIESSHCDDLIAEDTLTRIWISRVEYGRDGNPIITKEELINGRWEIVSQI